MIVLQFIKRISLYRKCNEWFKSLPDKYTSSRNLPVFLTVLKSASFLTDGEIFVLFKIGSFIFIIDDYYDTHTGRKNFRHINPLIKDLKESVSQLVSSTRFSEFSVLLKRMIDAMEVESKGQIFKDTDKYMSIAKQSIGLNIYNIVLYALIEKKFPNITDIDEYYKEKIMFLSSKYLRIINDLKSYKKEKVESKDNLFKIYKRELNLEKVDIKNILKIESDQLIHELLNMKSLSKKVSLFKHSVINYILFIKRLYKVQDYDSDSKLLKFLLLIL